MASKWDVTAASEDRKLAPKENDWALSGMGDTPAKRTPKKRRLMGAESSSETGSDADEEDSSCDDEEFESESSDEEEDHEKGKPAATRVTLEKTPLQDLVERNVKCPACGFEVLFCLDTVAIATEAHV